LALLGGAWLVSHTHWGLDVVWSGGVWTRESAAAVETAAHSEATLEAKAVTVHLVERERASLRLRLDAGWSKFTASPNLWGGAIEARVAGPLWLGTGYEHVQFRAADAEKARTVHIVKVSAAWEF
jgi:hypothetical protein